MLPLPALAQGYAGLGTEAEAYAQVAPGVALDFPGDHGPHPLYRIEWWYLTANLTGPDGAQMGLQWTLFRQAAAPGDPGAGWQSAQIWLGHAAVTTPEAHLFAERFARGGIGQAGVEATPFRAWIDDWEMTALPGSDGIDAVRLRAATTEFAYDLTLRAEGPLVFHGDQGYSVKSEAGQASYYYSQPHYAADGEMRIGDDTVPVTGTAWLDREWSSQPLEESQTGWDWLSLGFETGEKLMAFRVRDRDGGGYVSATWVAPDGSARALGPEAVMLTPLDTHVTAGRELPVRWRVELPQEGLDVEVTAVNPDAFMGTSFPYWEGPVTVTGSHDGRGYLEMTGYGETGQ